MENKKGNKDTFFKITNEDIYFEIQDLKVLASSLNGKINLNKWLGATALTLATASITAVTISFI